MSLAREKLSARARAIGLVGTAVLLSIFAWWPMLWAYPNTQGGDGPPYHKTLEAARVSVVRFHELPLWNPFECGGLPLWDNPQAPVIAPLVLPMFLIGTTATMYLWYVLHSALGFLSMWILARTELRLSREATFVASAAWAFSGFHQQHYSGGHFTFVPFLYFPLAIVLWRRAEDDLRMAVGLGLLVAWMIFEGGVYPLPHLAIFLAAEALMRAWPPRRLVRIVRAGLVVLVVGFLVGACRFLPVMDQLRAHTRPIGVETDSLQWETLKAMFLARAHERGASGQQYVWPEYGTYFGPILVALAVVGILSCGLENVWLLALLLLGAALMAGHAGRFAPWHILKGHVFPFREMRVPSRFRVEVSMMLAVFMGMGTDRLASLTRRWFRQPPWADGFRMVLVSLALIGVGDMLGVGITWFDVCFTNPPAVRSVPSARLYYGGPDLASMIDEPQQNRGRLACWDEWGFGAGAPLWEGDLPQARPVGTDAIVEVANRTANTFTIDVDVRAPSRILVNSSYDRGWRTDVGISVEQDKQLAIDLPPGRHRVHVKYWPHGLTLGLSLTTLGLAGVALFFVRDRKKQRERATA